MKSTFDSLITHPNSAAGLKKISKVLSLDASSVEAQVVQCDTVGGSNTHELVADLVPYYRGAVLRFNFKLSFNEPLAEDCMVTLFSNHSTDQPFTAIVPEGFLVRLAKAVWKITTSPLNRNFPRVYNAIWSVSPQWLRAGQLEISLGSAKRQAFQQLKADEPGSLPEDAEADNKPLESSLGRKELGTTEIHVKETSYMLSEASLWKLRSAGLPAAVLELLSFLLNQVFRGEKNFLQVLRTVLASGENSNENAEKLLEDYRSKIFEAAEKRFDTALYEKFIIEKDKPNYGVSMNLSSRGFSPAFTNNEAIWILLKPRKGAVQHLGLRLPEFCINNLVYLKAEPAYLYINLDEDDKASEVKQTIEFYRSDKDNLRIVVDPRMEKYPYFKITQLNPRTMSVTFDIDYLRQHLTPEMEGRFYQLRFLDELSHKHLDITVPLRIVRRRLRRKKSLRR